MLRQCNPPTFDNNISKMKKIAIIEFSCHFVYLATVVRAAKELGFYPVVFISEALHKNFSKDANLGDTDLELCLVDFSCPAQLIHSQQKLKHCKTILINTISPSVFYLIGKEDYSRCIVTVHNALSETEAEFSLSPCLTARKLIWLAKRVLKRLIADSSYSHPWAYRDITLQRRLLLRQAQSILVFHQNMIDLIARRVSIPADRIKKVPFNLPANEDKALPLPASPKELGYLSLAIIGNISFKRKNYSSILHFLKEFNKYFPVRITIIGQFSSESDRKRLFKLLSRTNVDATIVGGSRRASTTEILAALENIHLLLGIQPQFVKNGLFKELYGHSKASGAEFDSLFFNRLLLRPSRVPATRGMEGLSLCYDESTGFASILRLMLEREMYQAKYDDFVSSRNSILRHLVDELRLAFALEPQR